MTEIDTSREAVERMAHRLDVSVPAVDCRKAQHLGYAGADLLRALLARAEKAEAEVERLREVHDALHDITRSGGIRHMTDAQEKRLDAARAALKGDTP